MSSEQFQLAQIKAAISELGRLLAKPSVGSKLESISSLVQVLAIVAGGLWVLWNYAEFKRDNDKLTNAQLELTNTTAKITQELSKLALRRATEGRSEAEMEPSVIRSTRFEDGTYQYRYYVSFKVKNISDTPLIIPAIVVEFFVGTMPKDGLSPNEALYINLPTTQVGDKNLPTREAHKAAPGKISWTRHSVYAHLQIESAIVGQNDDPDKEVKEAIQGAGASPLAADFGGSVRSGTKTDAGLTFLIRSRPDAIVGAVITYWDRTADDSPDKHVYTNTELLSEAEDALSPKKDAPTAKDPTLK